MKKRISIIMGLLVVVLLATVMLSSCKKKSYQFMNMLGLKLEDIRAIHYTDMTNNSENTHVFDITVSKRVDRLLSNLNTITFTANNELKKTGVPVFRIRFFTEIPDNLAGNGNLTEEDLKKCKYVEYIFYKVFKKYNGVNAKTIEGYYQASGNPIAIIHNAD